MAVATFGRLGTWGVVGYFITFCVTSIIFLFVPMEDGAREGICTWSIGFVVV